MDAEATSLEPARGLSPLATNVVVGAVAFLAGILGAALMIDFSGGNSASPTPTPLASPSAAATSSAPVPAPPPGTDIATLSAREDALAAKLQEIEARLADADSGSRAASNYANQAERLMIAAATRRAIDRGLPLGPLEPQLRNRFSERHGEAVATIIQAARDPVTLEDLRFALDTIGPRLLSGPNDGLWALTRRLLTDLVVLRQAGSASPRPADRLKRARRTLDEGQVEAALAEVAYLPGIANAASWVTAAKRYIAVRAALREIEAAAIETPAAPPKRAEG